jgi:hypothetical protein
MHFAGSLLSRFAHVVECVANLFKGTGRMFEMDQSTRSAITRQLAFQGSKAHSQISELRLPAWLSHQLSTSLHMFVD